MTTKRLIELLDSAGLSLSIDEVLDALWLASHAPGLAFNSNSTSIAGGPTASMPKGAAWNHAVEAHAAPDTGSGDIDSDNATDLQKVTGERFLFAPVSSKGEKDGVAATPYIVPAGRALPNRLALMRALRPFARPWANRQVLEIDEDQTAELSAEAGGSAHVVIAVFKPGRERWFSVDIIIEDDVAVEVWDTTLIAFQRVLSQTGAFREVRLWRLALGGAPGEAMLIGTGAQQLSARRLAQDGARRLIMFATHGASQNWANGRYAELIGLWRTRAALLLLHLLPRQRWAYGALGEPNGVAHAQAPGLVAADLKLTYDWWQQEEAQASFATLPAIPLEPSALAEFASMTMGGSQRIEAFSLNTAAADWTTKKSVEIKPMKRVSQRLAQLRQASSEAYRLAIALSPTTFTLPVARLMQDAVLGSAAQPSQLGEIFLTGLVVPQDDERGPIDQRSFAFVSEAATQLMSALSEDRARKLSEEFGKRLAEHISGADPHERGFAALTPDLDGGHQLPAWVRPFVRVAGELAHPAVPQASLPTSQEPSQDEQDAVITGLSEEGELAHPAVPQASLPTSQEPSQDEQDAIITGLSEDIRRAPLATVMAALALHRLGSAVTTASITGILRSIDETQWFEVFEGVQRLRAPLIDAIEMRVRNALGDRRILWIDDMPRNNADFVQLLRLFGTDVDLRHSIREAYSVSALNYDLIVSSLTRSLGIELEVELVEDVRVQKQRPPIIIFAGRNDAEREATALASKIYAYTTSGIELFWLIGETFSLYARTRSAIGRLQKDLAAGGFYLGPGDGLPGVATQQALQTFQNEFSLPKTVWPGAACRARIRDVASRFPSQPRQGSFESQTTETPLTRDVGAEMRERSLRQLSMTHDVNSLRVYRHGYGRCILLKLIDGPVPNHVLINFGATNGLPHSRARLDAVLDNIGRETDGRIDHAIITKVSSSRVAGFADADRLYIRQLILGWWNDEHDQLGREIRKRSNQSERKAEFDRVLRILRKRSQNVRFMSPQTEPLALEGGARLYMFGGKDEHLLLRERMQLPELECAIELASGEVLLFISADRTLWDLRLQQNWEMGGRRVMCKDLLRRATFCSTHMLRREAVDFESILERFLPSLRVLNIPIDREFALQHGWVPPDVRDMDRVLRARGGCVIFNELDGISPKSSMIQTGPFAYDVRFTSEGRHR